MDSQVLKYADNVIYLGFTFSSDQKDDKDILRPLRMRTCYTQIQSDYYVYSIIDLLV